MPVKTKSSTVLFLMVKIFRNAFVCVSLKSIRLNQLCIYERIQIYDFFLRNVFFNVVSYVERTNPHKQFFFNVVAYIEHTNPYKQLETRDNFFFNVVAYIEHTNPYKQL